MHETKRPISDMFKKEIPEDWFEILSPLIDDERFGKILSTLARDKSFEPGFLNIFKAFQVTPLSELKVVILGQDPYPQKGVATGIAFANKPGLTWSPSLNIIADELQESIEDFNEWLFIDKVDLTHWAAQGILLLNSALTVKTNTPGSHSEIWRYFIEGLLTRLSNDPKFSNVIFVFMGAKAHEFSKFVNLNDVILCAHPAADAHSGKFLFRTSFVFKKIHDRVIERFSYTIKWD